MEILLGLRIGIPTKVVEDFLPSTNTCTFKVMRGSSKKSSVTLFVTDLQNTDSFIPYDLQF